MPAPMITTGQYDNVVTDFAGAMMKGIDTANNSKLRRVGEEATMTSDCLENTFRGSPLRLKQRSVFTSQRQSTPGGDAFAAAAPMQRTMNTPIHPY